MMQRLKMFRVFITMAALMFVARPFFGFATFHHGHKRPHQIHTILVKCFSKRKPESLDDAEANVEAIHQLITNPLAVLFSAISLLLLTLFPGLFEKAVKITQGVLLNIRYSLLPPENTYLLSGKLTI